MLGIFIAYPWLALVVGVVVAVLGWRRGSRGVLGAGLLWALYAGYETGMQQRWLCTGECNIRVDLLLIYPALLLVTGWAGWRLTRRRPATGDHARKSTPSGS